MVSPSLQELHTEYGTINASPSTTSSGLPASIRITPSTTVPTDIWRKPGPPKIDTFNAPCLYKIIPLSRFQSVRVTVSASWSTLYDQGGLVFILPASSSAKPEERKWIKTGIEFYQGDAYVSTVACDRWADWSLINTGIKEGENGEKYVELLIERKEGDDTFWVYVLDGEKKSPVREVTWVLSEKGEEGSDREAWVGVYAATPTGMEEGSRAELEVRFEGLEFSERK